MPVSTIGTIVDKLGQVPEALSLIERIIDRIQDARPEDRAAIIARMEAGAEHTQAAAERAQERLRVARRNDPTVPTRIPDGGEADG